MTSKAYRRNDKASRPVEPEFYPKKVFIIIINVFLYMIYTYIMNIHGFRLMKRDDYFRVDFVHFQIEYRF